MQLSDRPALADDERDQEVVAGSLLAREGHRRLDLDQSRLVPVLGLVRDRGDRSPKGGAAGGHASLSVFTITDPCIWAKQLANLGSLNGGKSLIASLALVYTSATSKTSVFPSLLKKSGLLASAATTPQRPGGLLRQVEKSGSCVIVNMLPESWLSLVPNPLVARLRVALGQIGQLQELGFRVGLVRLDRARSGRDGR